MSTDNATIGRVPIPIIGQSQLSRKTKTQIRYKKNENLDLVGKLPRAKDSIKFNNTFNRP